MQTCLLPEEGLLHLDRLKSAIPEVPEALNDRARDLWRPLQAIADAVGRVDGLFIRHANNISRRLNVFQSLSGVTVNGYLTQERRHHEITVHNWIIGSAGAAGSQGAGPDPGANRLDAAH